jgi:positive phototaxis protein PixI
MNPLALVPQTHQTRQKHEELYLRVRLDSQNMAILSMRYLQEVLVVPVQRLTPMPNVPACMVGLIERRSRVLWVIDLVRLLKLPSAPHQSQQYNIVVIQVGTKVMGLVLHKIEGIVRLSSDRIGSPLQTVSMGLVPYLRGCVLHEQQTWLLLDVPAIASSPVLHSY